MERNTISGTDLEASRICYGTAGLNPARQDEADRLLNLFRELGGNLLDTAHCYGFWGPQGEGASERALGDYIRRNGKGDLIVATKGGHPSAPGYEHGDRWLAPERIASDLDESLDRLGLDTIDLYWLHRDDTREDVGDVIEMLSQHVRAGRIRWIGASNWTCARIGAANAFASERGLQGFAASQVQWSLAHRDPPGPEPHGTQGVYAGPEEVAWHERTGLPLCPYTPTARGYFAPGPPEGRDRDNPVSRARRARAESLAARIGATANQVAIAWLLNHPFAVYPITGTQDPDHLRENVAAAEINLSPDQVAWLRDG